MRAEIIEAAVAACYESGADTIPDIVETALDAAVPLIEADLRQRIFHELSDLLDDPR